MLIHDVVPLVLEQQKQVLMEGVSIAKAMGNAVFP